MSNSNGTKRNAMQHELPSKLLKTLVNIYSIVRSGANGRVSVSCLHVTPVAAVLWKLEKLGVCLGAHVDVPIRWRWCRVCYLWTTGNHSWNRSLEIPWIFWRDNFAFMRSRIRSDRRTSPFTISGFSWHYTWYLSSQSLGFNNETVIFWLCHCVT